MADKPIPPPSFADKLVSGPTGPDQVPGLLTAGEYVVPAEQVKAIGDGDPEAGAARLKRILHHLIEMADEGLFGDEYDDDDEEE